MNGVRKVGRIADASHRGTSPIEKIYPVIEVVVALDPDVKGLELAIVIARAVRSPILDSFYLKNSASSLNSPDIRHILQVERIGYLSALGLMEVERFLAEDEVLLLPGLDKVPALFDLSPALLDDSNSSHTICSIRPFAGQR